MNITFKKLQANKKSSNITFSHYDYRGLDDLEAIAILTGGYNKYGRNIDISTYYKLKDQFESILNKIKNLK